MRIGIIGAGAIGGTIAALMERAGHAVEATARGDRLAAIQNGGLRLTGAWGSHLAQVPVGERLMGPPDLALLCVKAQDEEEALHVNASSLQGVPLVVVQNGLDGAERASRLHPGAPTIGAIAFFSADCPTPGAVRVLVPGPLYFGEGQGAPRQEAVDAASLLNQGIPAQAVRNFAGHQWTKLVVNQINAMPAITGLSVQTTLADPALRRIVLESIREAIAVGRAQGVEFGALDGMPPSLLGVLGSAPRPVGSVLLRIMGRRLGREAVLGSTLQSVQRGLPTEIDYLNGALVARAREVGLEAPVNEGLVKLVHEVEHSHRYYAPGQVAARMG
ncbi:2-dehydropantoate 2-reductase [Sinomonas notoginsengisoli]|uniref:ketopantoate reductase family protein n=1 Tax=Sinomonas notoginsengisoli TaxID=1457311 RepID=UPI001F32B829|nr:2-dehydropantoate 2-reductase [Sinomonas notoginsengisoli]